MRAPSVTRRRLGEPRRRLAGLDRSRLGCRAMDTIDELLANNRAFAEPAAGPPPRRRSRAGGWRSSPAWTRASTSSRRSGLGDGEAHVLRNAGGVITDDVIRSLAISQRRLGHARGDADPPHRLRHGEAHRRRLPGRAAGGDRGRPGLRDRVLRRRRDRRPPVDPAASAARPSSPTATRVRGFVYDVDTHRLREVAVDARPTETRTHLSPVYREQMRSHRQAPMLRAMTTRWISLVPS